METMLENTGSEQAAALQPVMPLARIGEINARIGRGMAELASLTPYWHDLAESLPAARFIHTHAWQMACVRYLFGHPESVYYVSFFSHGRAIAIFPLRRVNRSVGRVALWLWELPTHPHISLAEPLIAPDADVPQLIGLLLEVFERRINLPWHALHLPGMVDDAMTASALRNADWPLTRIEKMGESMHFDCHNLETAMRNCSSTFRRNLRRQRKKLEQRGTVTLTLARQGQALQEAFADFLRLEGSGWKGEAGRGSAICLHPELAGFYGELRDGFGWEDNCLIALLKLDGVAIAAQFCLLAGSTLSIQKIAYDEAWHAEAPGQQLMHDMLGYACANPAITRVSLLTAPLWAKGRWNPEKSDVWEAYFFNRHPRSLLACALRSAKGRLQAPWQVVRRHLPEKMAHLIEKGGH
jgi:CelD/BcsL family acetyltransferase involved in cellulose biosynthesis